MPPAKKTKTHNDSAAAPGKSGALYLVYGTDDLSSTRKADDIVNRLCPAEEQAFGLETFDPDADVNADAIAAFLRNVMQALLTPPFLGGAKTVYVRKAPYFNPMVEPGKFAPVKAEVEALVALLKKGLPEGVRLVVLTGSVHKATAFYKTFNSQGEVYAFDVAEKEQDAREDFYPALDKLMAERGISMAGPVLAAFTARTGFSLRNASMEVEKLSLYLGDRKKVTLDDVYLMVAPMQQGKFWEYADAFCKGDLGNTLRIASRLVGQGESPVGLVINLQNRLREILVVADCLKRGWASLSSRGNWNNLEWDVPPEGEELLCAMEKDPRKGNPFAITMMATQAARFPVARWYRWLNAAVDAQAAMTGGDAIDPALALELFTTRTLGELSTK
jgi:DNA polymerase III subunit delta